MWIFSISLVAAIVLSSVVLTRRSSQGMNGTVAVLSMIGFSLCVGALFGLPWLHLEPLEQAERVLQSFLSLDLSKLPESVKSFVTLSPSGKIILIPNLQEFLNALGIQIPELLTDSVLTGEPLYGWQVLQIASAYNSWFTIYGFAGFAFAALTAILNGLQVWSGSTVAQNALRIVNILLWLALMLFLPYLPLVDTFGTQDDLTLRLIMVLTQTRVSIGVGLFILGMFLSAVSGLLTWNMSSSSEPLWAS